MNSKDRRYCERAEEGFGYPRNVTQSRDTEDRLYSRLTRAIAKPFIFFGSFFTIGGGNLGET